MINTRDLRIDPNSLGAQKLLVDILRVFEYKDHQRTENVVGYRYVIALPSHSLEKIGVRIDGKQQMEKPDGYAEVQFDGLELTIYEAQGHVQLSAKAQGIMLAKKT